MGENPRALPIAEAPPEDHFRIVLRRCRDGHLSCRKGDTDVGKSKKLTKIKWCLAEAKRRLNRSALRVAEVISIHQDVQQARLAIRFQCCGPDLKPTYGILGFKTLTGKEFGLDSGGVRLATEHLLKDLI